jgi:hypothetical protein
VPEQLLPALPEGWSVVAHGVMTNDVEPVQVGGLLQGTLFVTVMPVTVLTVSVFEIV